MSLSKWSTKSQPVMFNEASMRHKLNFQDGDYVCSPREAFVSPFSRPIMIGSKWSIGLMKSGRGHREFRVATQTRRVILSIEPNENQKDTDSEGNAEQGSEGRRFKYRFDPDSHTDAFGRDPRKETEFWMGAAKSVLESDEVQQALAEHAAEGGDGLTDEQREYMEFIKSLDQD